MLKNKNGITLIALIITIIILLILAGITINMVLGENGLFNKAKTSVAKYENEQEKENISLNNYEQEINKYSRDDSEIIKNLELRIQNLEDQLSNKEIFIDTSRKIATIVNDTAYNSDSHSYTATENCIVTGKIHLKCTNTTTGANIGIDINSIFIGGYYISDPGIVSYTFYYPLKKGDTISFTTSSGTAYYILYAYGVK